MNFPSLLSDHEQRAFSEFLNQLAQEDNTGQPKVDGVNGPGGVDPTLTQQQQQQLQLQLQHHLHLRQLQQQHQQQQQQQQQNGLPGLPRMQNAPSLLPPPMALDPAAAQAQQQRDWIQQISSNPLLAPGGVINPHAMSQAMLQNPLLMAQANAISQAMVLAQQQQQLQLQLQQQQQQQQQQQAHHQQQQHFQQQHLQQQQQHDNHGHSLHHSMQQQQPQHSHPFQQQSHSMAAPPPPHNQQQQQPYPGQQHQQQQYQQTYHPNHDPISPTSESGASQQNASKPAAKRKSKSEVPSIEPTGQENGSASPRPSSPLPPSTPLRGQPSPAESMGMNGNSTQLSKQESDTDNNPAPPTKKAARRKGSMAKSVSMDSSSGLVVKSPHRSSRDGFDPMQGTPRKKGKSDSISKLGLSPSQQNPLVNGNSNDISQFKEESVEAESKQEAASPSPSTQQYDSVSPAPSQSTPVPTKTGTKKPPHELLTEAEKKANHIASEQKRRQNIRVGFDSLVEIVPTLSDCHRSEAVILQKSVDYIHRLLTQKNELKSRVRELQTHLGDPVDDVDSGSDMEVEQYE
ncbi:hypothetical protein BG015_005981 [Linnemannia schmuckeri]|uniref:BHLH domain-containing protein n=1 Tax=Linnemannia schmuckeri TaxID=64567 RepID=A0A9P5S6H2_9FUNG|nr:hypothetical protein BG015_005981 [Linnemannia schmuckeri]